MSRRTEVKVLTTIRYYEHMGLLEAPERSESNQRRFGKKELERLAFIRRAHDLGITIEAIRELIDRSDRIAREQLQSVRERIAQLKRLEKGIGADRDVLHGRHRRRDCYVIRALSDHALCTKDH